MESFLTLNILAIGSVWKLLQPYCLIYVLWSHVKTKNLFLRTISAKFFPDFLQQWSRWENQDMWFSDPLISTFLGSDRNFGVFKSPQNESNFWRIFALVSEIGKIKKALYSIKYLKLALLCIMMSRCPVPSTDQALPSCFYFRISWILMKRPWKHFFGSCGFLQGLRS